MTTALPPELAPWAPHLRGLVADLAVEIGTLARQLDAAIGPLRPRNIAVGGSPDGYSGISRRGPYDRLLLSEWALLDAVPDEFVRRAAEHEHAFYALEHRSPRAGVRCEAVFDAGPESLGAPRIGHVAMLIVLARRAEAVGAEFVWRVAQSRGAPRTGVDGPGVRVLLDARSALPFVPPAPPSGDADPMASARIVPDEHWFVGGPSCRGHAGIISAVIEEIVDPACDELVVRVERPGRSVVALTLPLPPSGVRRRLITDPLTPISASSQGKRRTVPTGSDPDNPWRSFPADIRDPVSVGFFAGTHQMYCAFRTGPVLLWSFGKVGTARLPKGRLELGYLQEPSIALGYRGQGLLAVVHYQTGQVAAYGKGISLRGDAPTLPTKGPGRAVTTGGAAVDFFDGSGRLWHLRRPDGSVSPQLHQRDGGYVGLIGCDSGAIALRRLAPETPLGTLHEDPDWELRCLWNDGAIGIPTALGHASWCQLLPGNAVGPFWQRIASACAGRVQAGRFSEFEKFADGTRRPLIVTWDSDVPQPAGVMVGAATMWQPEVGFTLVAVTWDAHKSCFRRSLDNVTLTVPRTPIHPQLSPDGFFVAFTTDEGTVEVWRYDSGQPILLARERGA